jgi:uncharacterized protein YndB with AHSA1/START domain
MMNTAGRKRTDQASRVLDATPQAVYRALVDPVALVAWLPPKGMRGQIHAFEPRVGGSYRMTLFYEDEAHAGSGKSAANADVVRGRFLELSPDERIVQQIQFDSVDPAFAGTMTMTWRLTAVPTGTEVAFICENVPEGIRQEDHEVGMRSTLENLAAFIEKPGPGSPP